MFSGIGVFVLSAFGYWIFSNPTPSQPVQDNKGNILQGDIKARDVQIQMTISEKGKSQYVSPLQKYLVGHWRFDHYIGDVPKPQIQGLEVRLNSISFYPDNTFSATIVASVNFNFLGKNDNERKMNIPEQITGTYKFLDKRTIKYGNEKFITSDEIISISDDELTLRDLIKKYKIVLKRIK